VLQYFNMKQILKIVMLSLVFSLITISAVSIIPRYDHRAWDGNAGFGWPYIHEIKISGECHPFPQCSGRSTVDLELLTYNFLLYFLVYSSLVSLFLRKSKLKSKNR
jgi:hypothetical protein